MSAVRITGSRPLILVVDDDYDLRESLIDTLEDEGYDVRWARDGLDALAELRGMAAVELILLDLNMPRMDGRAFRTALLADPEWEGVPLVVLSGSEDWQSVSKELKASAAFPKPFSVDQLLRTFRNLLR
jgi:two-component system, chemotaxis family, chemotaxis protein CheY